MVVQLLDLLLHSGLLGFEPPPDISPPFAFQLKINPRLNEDHAVSRLDHTLLAASHVLPIGATYPPSKEIFKILLVLELFLSPPPSGLWGAGLSLQRASAHGIRLAISIAPARAAPLEAQALVRCNELRFIPCKADFLHFLS